MKITIETEHITVSAANQAEHISEAVEMFKGLLVSAGYHPETVDQHIPNIQTWFADTTTDQIDSCASEQM